jgi:hypothetical protein
VGVERNKKRRRRRRTAATTGKRLWLRDEMFFHISYFKEEV